MKFLQLLQFYFGYDEPGFEDELEGFFAEIGPVMLSVFLLGLILIPIIILVMHNNAKKNQNNVLGTSDIANYQKTCIKAKVVNKINKNVNNYNDPFNHIIFEKENGERLEFALRDENIYNNIIVGDKGLLTFAGNAFIDFVRISQ